MTAFADAARIAADVLFSCFAEPGTYTAGEYGGTAVPVLAIRTRHDPVIHAFSGPGTRSPGWFALLRQSDVPERPQSDDRLTIGAENFVIRDTEEDKGRLFWRCSLNAA